MREKINKGARDGRRSFHTRVAPTPDALPGLSVNKSSISCTEKVTPYQPSSGVTTALPVAPLARNLLSGTMFSWSHRLLYASLHSFPSVAFHHVPPLFSSIYCYQCLPYPPMLAAISTRLDGLPDGAQHPPDGKTRYVLTQTPSRPRIGANDLR